MRMRAISPACLVGLALAAGAGCRSPAPRESDVVAVMDSFYAAIKRGDSAAAMSVIAPDSFFLEDGKIETRAEYEANHLPADIDFEQKISGQRGPLRVTLNGDTAWVLATTDYKGTVDNDPVDYVSYQLAVLTRDDGTWRIRTIDWTSIDR